MKNYAFQPKLSATDQVFSQPVTVSTVSQAVEIPGSAVRLANVGLETVYINFGSATVEATVLDVPVLVGVIEILSVPEGCTHMALVTESGDTAFHVTVGDGV